jgi:hypothetical protein
MAGRSNAGYRMAVSKIPGINAGCITAVAAVTANRLIGKTNRIIYTGNKRLYTEIRCWFFSYDNLVQRISSSKTSVDHSQRCREIICTRAGRYGISMSE